MPSPQRNLGNKMRTIFLCKKITFCQWKALSNEIAICSYGEFGCFDMLEDFREEVEIKDKNELHKT